MTDPPRQAYPLQWPEGWPRTHYSKRWAGRFQATLAEARDALLDQLRLLGARDVVISTAIPTRRDGLPYAGRQWRLGDDPGVVAYFTLGGKPKAIPCDAYSRPEANMRALALSVAALRALDRHGVKGLLERTFAGLAALPAPDIDWREVLGFPPRDTPTTPEILARWKERARILHPDAGGSEQDMARLNRAKEAALKELAT